MRLFISYARIDKTSCQEIATLLEGHEIWWDSRLRAGDHWWKEILHRLEWCEGFVYLLSPDSVSSDYCRKEFTIAKGLGKPIFPILIHPHVTLPNELNDLQYVDMSAGIPTSAVRNLLNSIHKAEKDQLHYIPLDETTRSEIKQWVGPGPDLTLIIQEAATAMGKEQYDQAVYLLKQVKAHGYNSRFINIDALLENAEASLERQTYRREAENAYRQIAALLEHEPTFKLGCESLAKFLQELPDYDPLKLAQKCRQTPQPDKPSFTLPLLQWCAIPPGKVFFQPSAQESGGAGQFHEVKGFHLSKYPITNAQFQAFINHPEGYHHPQWWCLSPEMKQWRDEHPEPQSSKFKGDERPREMVTWYEALAFCQWLSERMQRHVWLPSIYDWQRAFQGDDQRAYPWGNSLDIQRCNVAEGELKSTSIVTRYDNGVSPFGVYDMAGNVWEWCMNTGPENGFNPDLKLNAKRMVRGGSFISPGLRSNASFHYALRPESLHSSIGFRVGYYA